MGVGNHGLFEFYYNFRQNFFFTSSSVTQIINCSLNQNRLIVQMHINLSDMLKQLLSILIYSTIFCFIISICYHIQFDMEEKKAQISAYLRNTVSPFVTPLMEELVKKRPHDLLLFTKSYINTLIEQRKKNTALSESEHSEEDQEEADRKFQQKLKQKKNQKKLSRQGISAEAYGTFNKKQQFTPKIIQKSSQAKTAIRQLLKRSVLFGTLPDQDMNIVIDAMSIQQFSQGQTVIKEGEQGLTLFVVQSGEYECSKVINGKETYLKTYQVGESFGQLALMYTAPRAASIKCSKKGKLYGLDRQTFKFIIEQSANKRRQKFRNILSKVSVLSQIDPYQKEQLCDILKQEKFAAGSYVVRQGEQGNKFYMIAEGKLIAEKEGKKVFEFKQGDYFGEIALVRNTPRQASVKCISDTRVVWIDRDSFKRMFGPIEEILKRNQQKYKKYLEQ